MSVTIDQYKAMVAYWQTAHPPLVVDGEFGPKTAASVEAFLTRSQGADGWPLNPTVEVWENHLNRARNKAPLKFLNNWIRMESNGNSLALGIPGVEAGIFQTYHPDDDHFGQTFAQLRVNGASGSSTPIRPLTAVEAYNHAAAGVAYVESAIEVSKKHVAAANQDWSSWPNDYYRLAKLRHNLPVFGASFLPIWSKQLQGINSGSPFARFKIWVTSLDLHAFATIAPHAASFWYSREHLFDIADKCGTF